MDIEIKPPILLLIYKYRASIYQPVSVDGFGVGVAGKHKKKKSFFNIFNSQYTSKINFFHISSTDKL